MGRKPLGASFWQELSETKEQGYSEAARSLMACPDDNAPLSWMLQDHQFVCPSCARIFRVEDGILEAFPHGDPYLLSPSEIEAMRLAALENPKSHESKLWDLALEVAGDLSEKTVLDLCCGTGWAAKEFQKRGATVVAFDLAVGAGGLAEFETMMGEAPALVGGDVCRLPFITGAFDLIFVSNAIRRQKRPERMVHEINRCLKKDGRVLVINEPLGGKRDSFSDLKLTLSDYRSLFQEGIMHMRPLAANEPIPNGKKPPLLDRLLKAWRDSINNEPRVFLATKEKPFDPADSLFGYMDREKESKQ